MKIAGDSPFLRECWNVPIPEQISFNNHKQRKDHEEIELFDTTALGKVRS